MNSKRFKHSDGSQDAVLTLKEVARVLRLGRVTTLRLVQTSKLQAFKAGRAWRIRREDLERFIRPQITSRGRGRRFSRRLIAAKGADNEQNQAS